MLQRVASERTSRNPVLSEENPEQIHTKTQNLRNTSASASATSAQQQSTKLPVDIGISSLPQECFLTAAFPLQCPSNSAFNPNQPTTDTATKGNVPIIYVGVRILPNGDVKASERSLESISSRAKDQMTIASTEKKDEILKTTHINVKKLAKAIDVCGDMGLWVEWIRGEQRKRKN